MTIKLKNIKIVKQLGNSLGITFDADDKKVYKIKKGSKIDTSDMRIVNDE